MEYCDRSGNWHRLANKTRWYLPQASGADASTKADAPTAAFALSGSVEAKAVRLVNNLQDAKTYINVAGIKVNGTGSLSDFEPELGNDDDRLICAWLDRLFKISQLSAMIM